LRESLHEAYQLPNAHENLEAVYGRAKSLKRRKFGAFAVASLLAVSVAWAGWAGIRDEVFNEGGDKGRTLSAASASIENKVATFAIRSVASVGLLDPSGAFWDYQGIVNESSNLWKVSFESSRCLATEIAESCVKDADSQTFVRIRQRGDSLEVVEARSGSDDERRERLVGRQGAVPGNETFWEVPFAALAGPGQTPLVEGSPLWTGPLGIPSIGAKCKAQLLSGGEVVWESPELELAAPPTEEERSGGIISIGGMPGSVEGEPKWVCEKWQGSGWRAVGHSLEPILDEGESQTERLVSLDLLWDDPAFRTALTECTVVLFDSAGTALGEGSVYLPGPANSEAGPPFNEHRTVPVESIRAAEAGKAEVTCQLTSKIDPLDA
jgi:hypothetical protein